MAEFYLGIDVGWSKKSDTTGLCLVTLDQDGFRWECRNTGTPQARRQKDLKQLIGRDTVLNGVGIDGQLARKLESVNHFRAAEALLTGETGNKFRDRIYTIPTTTMDGQCLHHHATKLANLVRELRDENYLGLAQGNHLDRIHKYRIVEAYPTAFLAFLLADKDFQTIEGRGARPFWGRAVDQGYLSDLIRLLLPGLQLDDLDENLRQIGNRTVSEGHQRDAFVCALAAMCVSKSMYVAVGDPKYGDIILPPREVWGCDSTGRSHWAEIELQQSMDFFLNRFKPRAINSGVSWELIVGNEDRQ